MGAGRRRPADIHPILASMILPAFAPVLAFAQALLSTGSADKPQAPPFPGHTLYPLNDGGVIPSPAFGVGSALYQRNATGDVVLALSNGYRCAPA
jgi:hypothetical protein